MPQLLESCLTPPHTPLQMWPEDVCILRPLGGLGCSLLVFLKNQKWHFAVSVCSMALVPASVQLPAPGTFRWGAVRVTLKSVPWGSTPASYAAVISAIARLLMVCDKAAHLAACGAPLLAPWWCTGCHHCHQFWGSAMVLVRWALSWVWDM